MPEQLPRQPPERPKHSMRLHRHLLINLQLPSPLQKQAQLRGMQLHCLDKRLFVPSPPCSLCCILSLRLCNHKAQQFQQPPLLPTLLHSQLAKELHCPPPPFLKIESFQLLQKAILSEWHHIAQIHQ